MNLEEYLEEKNLYKTSQILEVILDNKFEIISNSNSHSYFGYSDSDGLITFNNPKMVINSESLNNGVIFNGRVTGNTIRFSDLKPIFISNRMFLIKKLEKLAKKINELTKKEKVVNEKLSFMYDNNLDELNQREYEKHLLDKIIHAGDEEVKI